MTLPQAAILSILAMTMVMFVWAHWRHDMVAMGALLACVIVGLVPADTAFQGFGHPAVITVACVLILSSGLQSSGAVDVLSRAVLPTSGGPMWMIGSLTGLAAVLSAFMNNVGALALLMPVALQLAAKQKIPPGQILMPLSFGSILGGMTTLIGTPPNLIVSRFRAEVGEASFSMFDFAPVGLAIALVGTAFVIVAGRWLVPKRERVGAEGFDTGTYITEARVSEKSKAANLSLSEIETALDEADAQVVGLIRDEFRIAAPHRFRRVRAGDILVIEAEPTALAQALSSLGLELEESADIPAKPEPEPEAASEAQTPAAAASAEATVSTSKLTAPAVPATDAKPADASATSGASAETEPHRSSNKRSVLESDEVILMELAVLPASDFVGRSASDIQLRTRYSINLLAVSRQGRRAMTRLRRMRIAAGDVMLMQGSPEALREFASQFGCVPLAERALRIPDPRMAVLAVGILAAAVIVAAVGLAPASVTFSAGVLAAMATRVVSLRSVYSVVDWPVIVLLAAMIPVADAMASSGTADLIARVLLDTLAQGNAIIALTLLLVVTMTLSDFMNNAATAALMCPIAIGTAAKLSLSADPFLMAVAIGASCAFLTPIGHQNNTLILGPGGFKFGDYWRLGLPLEILVVLIAVPMLLIVWPL